MPHDEHGVGGLSPDFGCVRRCYAHLPRAAAFLAERTRAARRREQALGFIPPAAFAALVANDLLTPGMFDAGFWPAAEPLLAAVAVVMVSVITKSLLWSAVTGVAVYALLSMIVF